MKATNRPAQVRGHQTSTSASEEMAKDRFRVFIQSRQLSAIHFNVGKKVTPARSSAALLRSSEDSKIQDLTPQF
jgi:hypothetical protein